MKNTQIIPLCSTQPNSKEVVIYVKVGGGTESSTNPDPQLSDYDLFLSVFFSTLTIFNDIAETFQV